MQVSYMNLQKLMSYTRRALEDYDMIQSGDRVCVGISGGKDSLALLYAMKELSRYYPAPFTVEAVTIDSGFDGSDFSQIKAFCERLGVRYTVGKTQIAEVVFNIRKEKNPCSLCANMRRGALNEAAVSLGCTKVALGHHNDDVIDTFFMNLLYVGRIASFSPVTRLDRTGISLIRPLIYAPEKELTAFAKNADLPVMKSCCPMDKHTVREDVKQLIHDLSKDNRDLKPKVFGAITRLGINGYKVPGHERNHNKTEQTDR